MMTFEATVYLIDKVGDHEIYVKKDNVKWFIERKNIPAGLNTLYTFKKFPTALQAAMYYAGKEHGRSLPGRVKPSTVPITLADKKWVLKYLLNRTHVCTTIEDHEILILRAIQKDLK